ncbi:Primosomal replication protein N prime prime [Salmonella enterica subsp. enterica]|uniref:Primosomal replication protein N prime prime n=1 Tax=Salmonella enterica I TaxID=59201 RepID=A0A379WY73_SALET|nr:Primosomal replication protein N prime prime [Salmonella enterica subsp. enterica]
MMIKISTLHNANRYQTEGYCSTACLIFIGGVELKTAMLLQTLEERLATLRQRCAPLAQHATLSARFDRHLFRTRSTLLQGYLEEADANLAALRQAVKHEQLPQVAWLAEHLASQLGGDIA